MSLKTLKAGKSCTVGRFGNTCNPSTFKYYKYFYIEDPVVNKMLHLKGFILSLNIEINKYCLIEL